MKAFRLVAAAVIIASSVRAVCAPTQRARYLMGTVCEIAVATGDTSQIDRAFDEASRIEAMLSTWRTDTELARLNRGEITASVELQSLLDEVFSWSRKTERAFDPRVRHLIDRWQLRGPHAPADPNPDAIEEGGFGKGYALDRMLAQLESSEAMINFGGQLAVRGSMRVTIAAPTDRQHPVLELTLTDASLSTSSGSEKTFERGGRTYSHIVDPRSGVALPARGSVSVIAVSALTADILSTALYVLGDDAGLRWADTHGVTAIFIDSNQTVRLSAPAREQLRDLALLDRNYKLKD